MGADLGRLLVSSGHRVFWLPEGRSDLTRSRALASGLVGVDSIQEMVTACDVILCICPPAKAIEVAERVSDAGFAGIYADLNAIAPQTVDRIHDLLHSAGIPFVDGAIIGPPPSLQQPTSLYLCGERTECIAELFRDSAIRVDMLGETTGRASAIKICDSLFNKGLLALLYETLAVAEQLQVRDEVMSVWNHNVGGVSQLSLENDRLNRSSRKAWRFIGEMQQVELTLANLEGTSRADIVNATETFSRLSRFRPGEESPTLDRIIQALLDAK
jgi:3-hydroxyisobutyrate dehydrogenase-like beta-hydroxyacid dehydrogenase